MKKKVLVLMTFSLALLALQSCVPSLYPLYTKDTIVLNDNILGTWQVFDKNTGGTTGSNEYMKFSKPKTGKHYICKYTVDGITNTLTTHIVKLGKYHYLDFQPTDANELNINSFMSRHLIPAHTFAKIKIDKEGLAIQSFSPDWLTEQIKNRYIRIKHEDLGDDIVITASTKDLQKFVMKYADHKSEKESAFLEASTWKRAAKQ